MVLFCFFSLSSIHIQHLPFSSANHHLLLLFTDLHCDTMRRVITHPSSFWWKIRDKVQTSLFCYRCRSPHLLLRGRKYFDFGASWKRSFVQLPFSHHGLADLWSVTIMIVWLGDWTSEYPGKLKWNDVWPITTEKNISSFIAIHSDFAPNRPCRQHMNLESNTESWMWNHTDVLSRREPMKLKQKFYLHEPFLQKSKMQKHALCRIKTLNSNSWFIMFGFRCYWRGMQWTPVAWSII